MKLFAALIDEVSSSTKTNEKLSALSRYFIAANEEDKIWTLALFTGRRPKRTVNSTKLHDWCAELAGIPIWLFEESYQNVGDLSETIALILPESSSVSEKSLSYWIHYLIALQDKTEEEKKAAITGAWKQLGTKERFVFNKLMSASFRIGVSEALVVNALAKIYDTGAQVMAHRISGQWNPSVISFSELMTGEHTDTDASKPYPFYLAYPLEDDLTALGEPQAWQAEWKWDGIRGQIIKRKGELYSGEHRHRCQGRGQYLFACARWRKGKDQNWFRCFGQKPVEEGEGDGGSPRSRFQQWCFPIETNLQRLPESLRFYTQTLV